jgi:inhibitor of KinA sporulation pathway (predicted exonuclease)
VKIVEFMMIFAYTRAIINGTEAILSIRKDKIIVIDLEATCWEGYAAPIGQENEIIEIGVCLYDIATQTIDNKRSLLVRPSRSVISPFCTQLTTITQELVDRYGTDFQTACEILERDYDSRNRLWASWGSFDQKMFAEQCKTRLVRYPLSKKHANLKRVYADVKGTRIGLKFALEANEISLEGTHHRGSDDAYNTAKMLAKLVHENGIGILKKYGM